MHPYAASTLQIEVEFVYLIIKSQAMTRQLIIERTVKAINQLPENKAEEISDFADFVIKRYEEYRLTEGIQKMASKSKTFQFLKDEEELYSIADLKEVYNA
jgi:Cu/Ag efflux pump CusA